MGSLRRYASAVVRPAVTAAAASTLATSGANAAQHHLTTSHYNPLSPVPDPPRLVSLDYIIERVKLSLVPFNAQDIYQVCTVVYNNDSLELMTNPDFMRGIADGFERCNQSVLSPFQSSMIADTLRKAGLNSSPKAMTVPEEDATSPESLLAVLVSMSVTNTRDERVMAEVITKMQAILPEFAPAQLVSAVVELGKLQCSNSDFLARTTKIALEEEDSLSTFDITSLARALCYSKGVPYNVLRRVFTLAGDRVEEFQSEDYLFVLQGIQQVGPQYMSTFSHLVETGLDKVENMDAETLTQYLICFTVLNYLNREHIEIYADALVDVATDLDEHTLVEAFIALQRVSLLSEGLFGTMCNCLLRYVPTMQPRHIAPVIEVCSSVPHRADPLMAALLDRVAECVRVFTPYQVGEVLDAVGLYPPARQHALVVLMGQQATFRLDIMGAQPLAMATRGLAQLGYVDPTYYTMAAERGFRFGFKDWAFLEPILMGLCLSVDEHPCPPLMAKNLGSHVVGMARSLSLQEVERANQYLTRLGCEDDYVYRAMASRVLQFVKEVTPDLSEELQVLLQRGAIQQR